MENKKSVLQDEDKFMLRMPDGMREKFAQIAKANNRSLNGELIQRLEKSLPVPADIIMACEDLNPIDRIDFAIKVLQRAGFNITLPPKEV